MIVLMNRNMQHSGIKVFC